MCVDGTQLSTAAHLLMRGALHDLEQLQGALALLLQLPHRRLGLLAHRPVPGQARPERGLQIHAGRRVAASVVRRPRHGLVGVGVYVLPAQHALRPGCCQ